MRPILAGVVLSFLLTGIVPSGSAAWSNGGYSADQNNPDYGTHDWIVEQALDLQTRDVAFMKTTYHARLLLGTEAPDNPEFIGDTQYHHVYYYTSGSIHDDVGADRAESLYVSALGNLEEGNFQEAAYCVGVMSHYISDAGAFGHTMGANTDWGAEVHHSDYEDHLQSIVLSVPEPTGLTVGNLSAQSATLNLAYTVTFGSGSIKPNTWMDSHYSWSDSVFTGSAYASLDACVGAVAAAINHLMIEASQSMPPQELRPGAPSGLSAVWTPGKGVELTWSAPVIGSVSSYLVYRGADLENREILATVSSSIRNWTDATAQAGHTYYYWVAASGPGGTSDLSAPSSESVPGHKASTLGPIIAVVGSAAIALLGASALMARRSRRLHRREK